LSLEVLVAVAQEVAVAVVVVCAPQLQQLAAVGL
jgi:hypothetical protein